MAVKLADAFVQVTTIKGNRYLDKCGMVMNAFDERFPEKEIQSDNLGTNTLSMVNRESSFRQVRMNVNTIWLSFERPPTPQFSMDQSTTTIQEICGIIDVTHFSRIALRTQHIVYEQDAIALFVRARRALIGDRLNTHFNW